MLPIQMFQQAKPPRDGAPAVSFGGQAHGIYDDALGVALGGALAEAIKRRVPKGKQTPFGMHLQPLPWPAPLANHRPPPLPSSQLDLKHLTLGHSNGMRAQVLRQICRMPNLQSLHLSRKQLLPGSHAELANLPQSLRALSLTWVNGTSPQVI